MRRAIADKYVREDCLVDLWVGEGRCVLSSLAASVEARLRGPQGRRG